MDCPKCKSTYHVKDGIVGGRQRHLCKNCKHRYTVAERGKPLVMKRMALTLYLEGNGFRRIGRILKVSQVAVMNWIRKFGELADKQQELQTPAPVIEMDELHTFVGVKKTTIGFGQRSTALKRYSLDLQLDAEELKQVANCIAR